MADRCLLHKSKLEYFKKWCADNNFKTRAGKDIWQVLQVYNPKLGWGVIYDRIDAKEHYTVDNKIIPIIRQFLKNWRPK